MTVPPRHRLFTFQSRTHKTNLCQVNSDKKLETSHITLWICWFLFLESLILREMLLFKRCSCCFLYPLCALCCAGAWTVRNSAQTRLSYIDFTWKSVCAGDNGHQLWCDVGERRPTQVLWQKERPVRIIPGLAALRLTSPLGVLATLPISRVSTDKCYWEISWFYVLTV